MVDSENGGSNRSYVGVFGIETPNTYFEHPTDNDESSVFFWIPHFQTNIIVARIG